MISLGKRVFYTGRVQGVGFRQTAWNLAQNFPLAGFVQNLADGRVELVVEGTAPMVQQFLDQLAALMKDNILDSEVEELASVGYNGFQIRR